jgi:DNA-binding NarL/FixJ family response regulator
VGVLVCSGFSKDDELRHLQAEGLSGFLRKPYRMVELSQAVAAACARTRVKA